MIRESCVEDRCSGGAADLWGLAMKLIPDQARVRRRTRLFRNLYTVAGLANEAGQAVEVYDYDAFGRVNVYRADTVSCDAEGDGDCDLEDFWAFQTCFDISPVCGWADVDTSGGAGLDDFAILSLGGVEGSTVYGTSRRWSGCVRRRLS